MGGVSRASASPVLLCLLCLLSTLTSSFAAATVTVRFKIPPIPYTPGLDVTAMDKSVDPCVDFYAYSCGGWQKNNPIPPDQSSWSVYSKLQDENRTLLRSILENAAVNDPHRGPINQKIGDFYASCMDEAAVNKAGAAALKPDLDRIAAMTSKADLAPTLAYLHPRDIGIYFGSAALFRFGSEQDAKNSSEVIASVDQGGLGFARPRLLSERRRQVAGHSRQVCGSRAEDVRTSRRISGSCSSRRPDRDAHRNRTGQGLHDSRAAPRSQECLSPDDGAGVAGAEPAVPVEHLLCRLRTEQPPVAECRCAGVS